MANSLSGEQVRERNIVAMGSELGELFTLLSTELTWLYWRWTQYVQLYADKPSRLEILNASAPTFFWIIQQTLWLETILGISRLAGPEATGKKQNLSVRRLLPLIADAGVRTDGQRLLVEVTSNSAFAMDWRNRHIAHRDLDLSLGRHVSALAPASKEGVDAALDSLAALLNRIERHHLNSTTAYRHSSITEDAENLLYVLRDGLRREQIRTERLESGEYRPEDWDDDAPAI